MWFSVHDNNNIVQGELTRNVVIKSSVFGLFTCLFFCFFWSGRRVNTGLTLDFVKLSTIKCVG